jgi:hypothetical protein
MKKTVSKSRGPKPVSKPDLRKAARKQKDQWFAAFLKRSVDEAKRELNEMGDKAPPPMRAALEDLGAVRKSEWVWGPWRLDRVWTETKTSDTSGRSPSADRLVFVVVLRFCRCDSERYSKVQLHRVNVPLPKGLSGPGIVAALAATIAGLGAVGIVNTAKEL